MFWLNDLINGNSTAHTIIILSLVICLGYGLGSIKVFRINFGIAGVLFSGLLFGHLHITANHEILEFVREFGLVLFVYTIGMQVGPSFFASFRREGLKLNLLAVSIVVLGVITAIIIKYAFDLPPGVIVGLLSGAVTNTPGLGAAQQALKETGSTAEAAELAGMSYAVAYPFGILGIIITMLLIKKIMRVNVPAEIEDFEKESSPAIASPENYNIQVTNPRLIGIEIRELASLLHAEFVISRLMRKDQVIVPVAETTLELDDILHIVCSKENAEKLGIVLGEIRKDDIRQVSSNLSSQSMVVTNNEVVGKSVAQLNLMKDFGVAITRVHRAGIELIARANTVLNFGDRLTIVGPDSAFEKIAKQLGNSIKKLSHPNIIPIFFGIILGVMLGSIPFNIPGIPVPVKLGLAGGPLLIAIFCSRYGKIGPMVWHLPHDSNLIVREIGIALFLACVGLKSGAKFLPTLLSGDGLNWVFYGAAITIIPLLIVGFTARIFLKINYLSLCGLLAGSMTDPPALSFANQATSSDAPSVTYASVYALVMFLRIISAQALILMWL